MHGTQHTLYIYNDECKSTLRRRVPTLHTFIAKQGRQIFKKKKNYWFLSLEFCPAAAGLLGVDGR